MQQHKLEIKGKLFIRGYTTQKMAETHTTCFFTGININRVWKDDKTWFGQYAATYATAALNGSTQKMLILQQETLLIRVD
jgi:hypothetical protein